jgi:hypothetical protein
MRVARGHDAAEHEPCSVGRWREQMKRPLRPARQRLPLAVLSSLFWFAFPFLNGGSFLPNLVLAAIAGGLHLWLWGWGPSAREPSKHPEPVQEVDGPEGPFPIWVERRNDN